MDKVLEMAGLPNGHRSRALIDLGFGCGDQTIHLMKNCPSRQASSDRTEEPSEPLFQSYLGITLDSTQFAYAQGRISERLGPELESIRLCCADAAKPDDWNDDLRRSLYSTTKDADEVWVLALDTLYHFHPSRWPIIRYASHSLKASFMSFDLCLAENPSLLNLLILRVLTRLMGAPSANFVTMDRYREQLLEAGYNDITITDISPHVFAPLADFLDEQDAKLRLIGFGLGAFNVAKWMFRWWGKSGVVRGIIVVAKR